MLHNNQEQSIFTEEVIKLMRMVHNNKIKLKVKATHKIVLNKEETFL